MKLLWLWLNEFIHDIIQVQISRREINKKGVGIMKMKRKNLTSLALTIVITLIMASMLYMPAYAAENITVTTKTDFMNAVAHLKAGDVINIDTLTNVDHMILRDGEKVVIPSGVTLNIIRGGYLTLYGNSILINNGNINNSNALEIADESYMENNGTIINNGRMGAHDLSFFKNERLITNNGTFVIHGKFINNGSFINTAESYLVNEGPFENAGLLEIYFKFDNGGPLVNTKTGKIIIIKDLYNGSRIENYGIIQNDGFLNNGLTLINYNLIINNNEILNNPDFSGEIINYGAFEGAGIWKGTPPINTPIKVVPTAYVIKTTGNTNQLFITITEYYPNGIVKSETYQITAKNNDATVYKAGKYNVYVNVKGNTDVREIRLV